jgi:cytochrome c553
MRLDLGIDVMVRGQVVFIAMCLVVASAVADPKIDSTTSVFKQTEADAAKLVTFCAMSHAMEAAGEQTRQPRPTSTTT